VRAVFGSFSGPMTMSATTAMMTISEKPMSNMVQRGRAPASAKPAPPCRG
jgi:hypothetical protein